MTASLLFTPLEKYLVKIEIFFKPQQQGLMSAIKAVLWLVLSTLSAVVLSLLVSADTSRVLSIVCFVLYFLITGIVLAWLLPQIAARPKV